MDRQIKSNEGVFITELFQLLERNDETTQEESF